VVREAITLNQQNKRYRKGEKPVVLSGRGERGRGQGKTSEEGGCTGNHRLLVVTPYLLRRGKRKDGRGHRGVRTISFGGKAVKPIPTAER